MPTTTAPAPFEPYRPTDRTTLLQITTSLATPGTTMTVAWSPMRMWADDIAEALAATGCYARVQVWSGTECVATFGAGQ